MKSDELDKSNTINHKVLKCLECLMAGLTIKWEEKEVGMAKAENDGYALYFIWNGSDTVFGLPMEFQHIYKWLNSVPDEEFTILCANLTLNKLK